MNLKTILKKKKQLIIVIVILVVLGAGFVYSLLSKKPADVSQEDKQKYAQLEADTAKSLGSGDYKTAASNNEQAYYQAKTEISKARLAYEVGSAYASERDFENAKKWMNLSLGHYNNVTDSQQEVDVAKEQIKNQLEQIAFDENIKPSKQNTENPDGAL